MTILALRLCIQKFRSGERGLSAKSERGEAVFRVFALP